MNTGIFYLLLLCFVSGFTQCMLIGCSILLLRQHSTYQFQRAFAIVLLMLSVGFLNNFVVSACSNLESAEFINTLLVLYDYVIVGGFMFFIVSLVFPSRYNTLQLSMFEIPYVIAIILYIITRSHLIYPVVQIFTLTVSTFLLIWLSCSIKKYNKMLRDNMGNIEYFDLHWGTILMVLLYIVQLIWAVESLSQHNWFTVSVADRNLIFDTIWCFITMAYVVLIMNKIILQQVFVVPAQDNTTTDNPEETPSEEYYKILNNSDIDLDIKTNKYYLDATLTLQKLATHLGTNRQYLSNYINRVKGKTFYEYINDFRLEEAKNILDNWDNEHPRSMDDIAALSGFNSYSTFLRSFVKKYDVSPSKYLKGLILNGSSNGS
ncbi:MAG: AraC family transcriptional regulator [Bacteroidales bacterium]|nr:AraC family transcriptional regulator [Bacteroidales bacterium]